jgi:hypothetical protein
MIVGLQHNAGSTHVGGLDWFGLADERRSVVEPSIRRRNCRGLFHLPQFGETLSRVGLSNLSELQLIGTA